MEKVLTVKNLSKSFGKNQVVNDISFEVMKGDIMGTLGPNGAGKSTLIRNIMGMIYPDSGTVEFNIGGRIQRIIPDKIGYLPEERGLYKDVTIQDIVYYIADLKEYPREKTQLRLSEYLEKFDLGGMEKKKIEELSKGMAQKVQFICSVIHEPEFLILDEPFSGLDPVSQDLLKDEIKSLSNSGVTILLSSHQMNLVEAICNRIFLINKGKQVIYGSLDEVKEQFADFKCTIYGTKNHGELEGLASVARVVREGDRSIVYIEKDTAPNDFLNGIPSAVEIKELHMDRISLHDIFVSIAKGGVSLEKDA